MKKSISKKYLQGFFGFFFVTFVYVLDVSSLGIKGVLSHRPVMMDVLDGRVFSSSIWCFDERGGNYDKQQKMPCDNTLTARRGRQQLQNCLKLSLPWTHVRVVLQFVGSFHEVKVFHSTYIEAEPKPLIITQSSSHILLHFIFLFFYC